MENQVGNKFTWVIKDFGSLTTPSIYSDPFMIGGCKWRLLAYPKGMKNDNNLSLFLDVVNYESLPRPWRRHAKFSFTIANQIPCKISQLREIEYCFGDHAKSRSWGFPTMFPLTKLKDTNRGFFVNGDIKIVVEIEVLEVIGKLDVSEESEEQPLKKTKLNDNNETSLVNVVQVLPTQVELVSRIFKKHPDIALQYRSKNRHVRTGYVNVLLSLTRMLCQSPQEISNDDLSDVGAALVYMRDGGFNMDWWEKSLEEVKEKKKKEEACLARLREMDEELQPLKQKCLDLEALVDKEKAELLEARTPLSL